MYFITTKRMLEVCFFQHTPTFIIEPNFKEIRLALLLFLQLHPLYASRFQATNPFSSIQKTIGKTGKRLGL